MTKELVGEGFALATKGVVAGTIPALVEVYPLAALVRLLGYKPNYKTARLRRYLKNVPKEKGEDPITWLFEQWEPILDALGREVREAKVPIPDRGAVSFVSRLKPYEDALDAIVSAWVGALYVEGRAEAFGDETAAIWIPRAR
jgi:predicted RNase H-like nuclease